MTFLTERNSHMHKTQNILDKKHTTTTYKSNVMALIPLVGPDTDLTQVAFKLSECGIPYSKLKRTWNVHE